MSPDEFKRFIEVSNGSKTAEEAAEQLGLSMKDFARKVMQYRALGLVTIGPASYLYLQQFLRNSQDSTP